MTTDVGLPIKLIVEGVNKVNEFDEKYSKSGRRKNPSKFGNRIQKSRKILM